MTFHDNLKISDKRPPWDQAAFSSLVHFFLSFSFLSQPGYIFLFPVPFRPFIPFHNFLYSPKIVWTPHKTCYACVPPQTCTVIAHCTSKIQYVPLSAMPLATERAVMPSLVDKMDSATAVQPDRRFQRTNRHYFAWICRRLIENQVGRGRCRVTRPSGTGSARQQEAETVCVQSPVGQMLS